MAIAGRWRRIDSLPPGRGRDPMPGVYELADAERRIIYVGMSEKDVPARLKQHLSRPGRLSELAVFWRYEHSRVPQAREAQLLEQYRARYGCLPECNTFKPLQRDARRRYRELSSSRD